MNFILLDTKNINEVLNIVPYCYIVSILLDPCTYFEHAESIHSDSHVWISVQIGIDLICQSYLDILCCLRNGRFGGSYWPYKYIWYMKVCMQCCLIVRSYM